MADRLNLYILNLESEFLQRFSKKALIVMDESDLKLLTKELDKCLAEVYNYASLNAKAENCCAGSPSNAPRHL